MMNFYHAVGRATIVFFLCGASFFGVSLAQAAPLSDPLINGGFETAGANAQSAFDWQVFGRGYERVRMNSLAHSGEWAIRIRSSRFRDLAGAFQRIDLAQKELKPVFVGGYVRGERIVNGQGGYFGASLYAEIHLRDGSVVYWNSIANFGTFNWRWIGFNAGNVPGIQQPIDHIFVVPLLGNAAGTAWFDDITVAEFDPTGAAVTLMFDDGELTTHTVAKPVLDTFGFAGSAAVITDMIGEEGYMGASELKELVAGGWEIVSHSESHSDMTKLTRRQARNEMINSKEFLENLGFTVDNFAFPFGAYNGQLIADGAPHYNSLRAFESGDNPQGTFPFEVKVRGVQMTTTPAQVLAWVHEAMQKNRWSVLVFHAFGKEGDDAFHTDPEVFLQMIEAIASTGVDIVTYQQGLLRFAVTP